MSKIRGVVLVLWLAGITQASELRVGWAEVDVTPDMRAGPVFIAGFGQNRKATDIADPIMARGVVLSDGQKTFAIVSVDVIGLFHANVERIRSQLQGIDQVIISSTHNHEGPDTLGLWGPAPTKSGVDPKYMQRLERGIVEVIESARRGLQPVTARIGRIALPDLIHDTREPFVKHDELVALRFIDRQGKDAGLIVQWNCHPETLDSKNTKISADFVGYTVQELKSRFGCPVVYLTGTVGGLLTSLRVPITDDQGKELKDGTFEKTERFGKKLAAAAATALERGEPIELTPFQARTRVVFVPCDNKIYQALRRIKVLDREAFHWDGDPRQARPADDSTQRIALKTEIGWWRLGELDIAAIPGEIYSELVLNQVPDPAPEGADFPDAPREPAIYEQLSARHRMTIGLANDEIGYILPKRLWDEKAPFTYGRKTAPYGEINSLGPEAGPILCEEFRRLVRGE
ncbi:MAG: neutral/alkaline non-lysosomal ceramidase N-terminal domain-containing protein [Gemmataceae bacterium]|nr:neutral/alkaline non-lysosomal ceramidase N-terminal domain-containing protein [Gemmataceae bacterium]